MPTYATADDVRDYVIDYPLPDDDDDIDRIIERAERDIDSLPLPAIGPGLNGLRYDPLDLSTMFRDAINRATCAQTEYRFRMGPKHFATAQYESVTGPDYSVRGTLPIISPQARRELRISGLSARWARVI